MARPPGGTGWRPHDDARDLRIADVIVSPRRAARAAPTRTSRYWFDSGWWGDQRLTDACTGYGPAHALADGPVTHRVRPLYDPMELYRANVAQDRADGRVYDAGATMLAACKVLTARAAIGEYRWARTVDEVVDALLNAGPVLFGTVWLAGMDAPDPATGVVRCTGPERGGHCYEANGVNLTTGLVRCKNSWGRGWGKRGRFWLRLEDVERVLLPADGEAVLFREMPDPPKARGTFDTFGLPSA